MLMLLVLERHWENHWSIYQHFSNFNVYKSSGDLVESADSEPPGLGWNSRLCVFGKLPAEAPPAQPRIVLWSSQALVCPKFKSYFGDRGGMGLRASFSDC